MCDLLHRDFDIERCQGCHCCVSAPPTSTGNQRVTIQISKTSENRLHPSPFHMSVVLGSIRIVIMQSLARRGAFDIGSGYAMNSDILCCEVFFYSGPPSFWSLMLISQQGVSSLSTLDGDYTRTELNVMAAAKCQSPSVATCSAVRNESSLMKSWLKESK